jgi:hypothetical protein
VQKIASTTVARAKTASAKIKTVAIAKTASAKLLA